MITDLLEAYVSAYEYKMERNRDYRSTILWTCVTIIVLFAVVLALLPFQVIEGGMDVSELTAFMTASVSFLTLVVGVLHIVTKYVFPENDEEYITRIVESIQKNDLENRKETARQRDSAGGSGGASGQKIEIEPIQPGNE